MASDSLKLELLRFMKDAGAVPMMIDAWALAWYNATLFPSEPLPCPACYLGSQVRRLQPAEGFGKISAVQCEYCHTRFEFLDD